MDTIRNEDLRGLLFSLLFIISCQINCIKADAKLSIKFMRYENPFKLKYDLRCCDGELRFQQCTGGCDHNVRVCIDSMNTSLSDCNLGSYDLGGVAFDEASFDFPSFFLGGLPNPYPISLRSWQGGVQVRVSLYDGDTGPDELMDEFQFNFTQRSPFLNFVPNSSDYINEYFLNGERPVSSSRLSLAIQVYCDSNFYGDGCSINCVPENDCLGHYECNRNTGEKICLAGWSGQDCNIKVTGVEDCLPSQTCNSGTCVPEGGNSTQFYCCCDPGFTGDLCDLDINECLNNPCQNGGICSQDMPNSFQCACSPLFTGTTCERQKTCSDDPCGINGICIPLGGTNFQCACSGGATGDFCEIPLITTTSTTARTPPTSISTTTLSTTVSNNRFCPSDFYGPFCSVFCKADDSCESGYFTCDPKTGFKICSEGWGGPDCATRDITYIPDAECPESSCRNSGVCKNSTCCCAQGFTGRLCHIEILECDSNPCINGGRCRDRIGDYQCECMDSYTGRNCEVIIIDVPTSTLPPRNPCDSITCENGGVCLNDKIVGPLCLCPKGYSGVSCRDATNTITNTVCPPNTYGPECDTFCIPQDSCSGGHYDCHYSTGVLICHSGWAGPNCQERFLSPDTDPECPSNECRNGGVCNNGSCCCPLGYSGEFCQEEIFECSTKPCRNNGRCVELPANGFRCDCPTGFTGDVCEMISEVTASSSPTVSTSTSETTVAAGSTMTTDATTTRFDITPTTSSVSNRDFVGRVYLLKWWKFLRLDQIADVIRYAINLRNSRTGLFPEAIQITPLEQHDTLDQRGRNVAELTYSASLASGVQGPLLQPTIQSLEAAIVNLGYNIKIYDGPTPWRYIYHYDLYYKAQRSETVRSVITKLNNAWLNAYPEYQDCDCSFVIRVPRRVRYLDRSGSIVTRYIYFVMVDGRLNDPAVQPGPSIPELVQYFVGTDGETVIGSQTNLTQFEEPHQIYLTGNVTDTEQLEVVLETALTNTTSDLDGCGRINVSISEREIYFGTNGEVFSKIMYTVYCDDEPVALAGNTSIVWDVVDEILDSAGNGEQRVYRNTTEIFVPSTTPVTDYASTISSTSIRDFVGSIYLLKWWKFLSETQVVEILRDAIYLRNLPAGISAEAIQITTLERHDALDQRGRNVAELTYNASLATGFQGPLLPPTLQSLEDAIDNRGYNIKIYDGPTPWRYIYHYDLYYKAQRSETVRSVITKLNNAWLNAYPEYQDCDCSFVIRVPRRVRYLDRSGSIVTRYIYFVMVDGRLNDPAVQPGPSIPELVQYFVGTDGETVIGSQTNLTQFEEPHQIYLTGNVTDTEQLEVVLETALTNTTSDLDGCGRINVSISEREIYFGTNGEVFSKIMYTVYCDDEPVALAGNTSIVWDVVDEILDSAGNGEQRVYRNTTDIFIPSTTPVTDYASTISSTSIRDFVGRIYLFKWWKFLSETQVMEILRDAIYLRNLPAGISAEAIQITTLERHDALDQRGRNVAELTYNASLATGFQGPLLPPTLQSLEDAIDNRGYNIKIYDGPTPWRYIYHYDLYYKTGKSETLRGVIAKLNGAWMQKYPEYQDCGCTFVIRVPRRVRYLDRNGSIITRYIYFVLVDGRLNDPAVQPGPSIPELVQYFVGADGETVIVSQTNLTQHEEPHQIYLTGNVTDTEQLEVVLETALINATSDLDGCGIIRVNVTGNENQFDVYGELVSKIIYTVYCDEEPMAPADDTTILWDIVDGILTSGGDGGQKIYRNTTEIIFPTTTPVSTDFASTISSTSVRDFVGKIYLLRWWKFLSEIQVVDILRSAIYLRNADSDILPEDIQITTLEMYDALDPRGRNVAELTYNASLVPGFQGPLLPPTLQSLNAAIDNRGYNIKIYDGPTPWRYIYHYDLYYKAGKSETLRGVIAKLNRAWVEKYPEYQDCDCSFVIRVPRRVRYLDGSGSIITRYIYFVMVDGRLNDPAVQPGPSIPELVQYFVGTDGETLIVSETNLTQYEESHKIYLTGNVNDTQKGDLEDIIKTALINSTTDYSLCVTFEVNVTRTELQLDPNGEDVSKIMYTVHCDDEPVAPADNTSIFWDVVDELLVSVNGGEQRVYRNTTELIYPTPTAMTTPGVETTTSSLVVVVTSQSSVTDSSALTLTPTTSSTTRTLPSKSTTTSRPTTSTSTPTTSVTKIVATHFNGSVFLYKWWRYLSDTEVLDVLRFAIYQTNLQFISGLRQDSIVIDTLEKHDAMDASGRNLAELKYNASLVSGFQGPLLPPTLQSLNAAIDNRGYNIRIYEGPTPWRYIYHYDLYYKAGKSEKLRGVILKLNRAWIEKYSEYQNCECEFTIIVARTVRYLDRDGTIITRYIYFVLVDDVLNDPAVQPGPSIPELVQYFVGTDGETLIVSETNLTQYEEHHKIYLTGNLTDTDPEILQDVLKTALLNSTTAYRGCKSLNVNVARIEPQMDVNGQYISKVLYTVECDRQFVEPLENDTTSWNAVDAILSSQDPDGPKVYRFGGRLFYPSYAYTLFINGDFIGNLTRAILATWKTESTEIKNCNCQVTLNIVRKETYVGVYGIQLTGIMYFMTKAGQLLDPETSPAPSRESFQAAIRDTGVYNTLYSGDQTRLYSLYYSLLTRNALTKERQVSLLNQISTSWTNNLPASLPSCSDCSFGGNLAKPEIYYTTSGEMLYRAVYSLDWGDRVISPLQTSPPSDTVLARDGLEPCGCQGLRRRHVDFKGRLSYLQIQSAREKISAIWGERKTDAVLVYKDESVFVDKDSNAVTRVYFTVSVGQSDASVSLFELSNLDGFSAQLAPFEPVVHPSRQVYHVYLWGTANEDTTPLAESVKNAWLGANKEIAMDAVTVTIINQDGDYTSGDDGESVTRVEYTVAILDADSSIANVEEPSSEMYESTFGDAGIKYCGCVARKIRDFYIAGSLDNSDDESLQEIVSKAWKESNPDFSGTLTTAIVSKNNGYQSSTEDGIKLTRVIYTVTPDADQPDIKSTALDEPNNTQLNKQLQMVYPELTTFEGDVIKEKVESSPDWVIPVVIVICLLVLVIIVVIIVLVIRNYRNRKSRTLKRHPNEIRGFDKEHFSTEPEFDNPAYDPSEANQKNEVQYMNMSQ